MECVNWAEIVKYVCITVGVIFVIFILFRG